jgi:hypothetical protein
LLRGEEGCGFFGNSFSIRANDLTVLRDHAGLVGRGELTDVAWARIEPLLPRSAGRVAGATTGK